LMAWMVKMKVEKRAVYGWVVTEDMQ
jgi:hypothetical protein